MDLETLEVVFSSNASHAEEEGEEARPDFFKFIHEASTIERQKLVSTIDHGYCTTTHILSGGTRFKTCKVLFLDSVPKQENARSLRADQYIDVESVDSDVDADARDDECVVIDDHDTDTTLAQYQKITGQTLELSEERSAENVDTSCMTPDQRFLFSGVLAALAEWHTQRQLLARPGRLHQVRLSAEGDSCGSRIWKLLTGVGWRHQLLKWLHVKLVTSLEKELLVMYLQVLKILCGWGLSRLVCRLLPSSDVATLDQSQRLLDSLFGVASNQFGSQLVEKYRMPVVSKSPVFVWLPCSRRDWLRSSAGLYPGRRLALFKSKLAQVGQVFTVDVTSASDTPASAASSWMWRAVLAARVTLFRVRQQHPASAVVLVGWRLGALLAAHLCLVEPASACVCFAPPLHYYPLSLSQQQRYLAGDPLFLSRVPTLFVVGERAVDACCEQLDQARLRLPAELVVVATADSWLRVSSRCLLTHALTPAMVDTAVIDEVGHFLSRTLSTTRDTRLVDPPSPQALKSCEELIAELSRAISQRSAGQQRGKRQRNTDKTHTDKETTKKPLKKRRKVSGVPVLSSSESPSSQSSQQPIEPPPNSVSQSPIVPPASRPSPSPQLDNQSPIVPPASRPSPSPQLDNQSPFSPFPASARVDALEEVSASTATPAISAPGSIPPGSVRGIGSVVTPAVSDCANKSAISGHGNISATSARGSIPATYTRGNISARGNNPAISVRGNISAISARGNNPAVSTRGNISALSTRESVSVGVDTDGKISKTSLKFVTTPRISFVSTSQHSPRSAPLQIEANDRYRLRVGTSHDRFPVPSQTVGLRTPNLSSTCCITRGRPQPVGMRRMVTHRAPFVSLPTDDNQPSTDSSLNLGPRRVFDESRHTSASVSTSSLIHRPPRTSSVDSCSQPPLSASSAALENNRNAS